MKRLLLCAVLVVGMAGPAVAGFETGNTLLAKCQEEKYGWFNCMGYVKGIADALSHNSPLKKSPVTGIYPTGKHNAAKAVSPSCETMRMI